MKKFFAIAAALLIGVAAFAQETNKDENGKTKFGGYETNKFLDNWFVDLGAGINTTWDISHGGLETGGLAVQVDLGKWLTPEYGVRLGWRGLKNSVNDTDDCFNFFKGDFLLNFSNLVAGYKELRTWDLIPFIGAGVMLDDIAEQEYGAELGLINNFRLSNNFDINLELGGIIGYAQRYGDYDGRYVTFPYATLGLVYNFNRSNFTRVSTTAAAAAAAIAAANAAADAAKKEAADAKRNADGALADANNALAEAQQLKDEAARAANDKGNIDGLFDEPVVVYFELGKSTLTAREKAHAEYVIKNIIARGNNVKFTLSGNADKATGSAKRNQVLSEQRANTVLNLVKELGLSEDQFTVEANGGIDLYSPVELNRCVIIEKQ